MNKTQIQEAFVRAEELRLDLLNDKEGELARQLLLYFHHAELAARAMQQDAGSISEQGMASDIASAFAASGSLVIEVWQLIHECELNWSPQEDQA